MKTLLAGIAALALFGAVGTTSASAGYYGYGHGYGYRHYHCYYVSKPFYGYYGYYWRRVRVCGY
jgi:hypothetical protein